MHIGGESNDPDSKKPWLVAIEEGDHEILSCYRHVSEPMKGGSFGVDLHVGAAGGHPEVRAVRQKIGDKVLEECMTRAFSSLNFQKPERPTMLSYSILFKME